MTDPLVGLRPTAIVVTLAGWDYTIPELSAADWVAAILAEAGGSIVPGLLNVADRRDIWSDYAEGNFTEEELAQVERDALAAAAGRPWWEADRLVRSAVVPENRAIINGEMLLRGIDAGKVSLAGLLDAIYILIRGIYRTNKDDTGLSMFEMKLKAVPAGVPLEEIYDQEDAAASFLAAMAEEQGLSGGAPPG